MANVGGLQLLPETRRKIDIYIPGQNRLLIIAGLFVALVVAVWGGLYFYNDSLSKKIQRADSDLQAIDKARNPKDEEKLLKLKDAIAAAKPVLANHVIWSEAFARIQKEILPQVQFDSLGVKLDKGEYTFKAFAASFITVAKQIAAFNADDAITDSEIGKISAGSDGKVEFTAKLNLDLNKINKPEPIKK